MVATWFTSSVAFSQPADTQSEQPVVVSGAIEIQRHIPKSPLHSDELRIQESVLRQQLLSKTASHVGLFPTGEDLPVPVDSLDSVSEVLLDQYVQTMLKQLKSGKRQDYSSLFNIGGTPVDPLIVPTFVDGQMPTGIGGSSFIAPTPSGLGGLDADRLNKILGEGTLAISASATANNAPAVQRRRAVDLFVDVVAVASPTKAHCTGIAIAKRYVLTARHCLPATRVLLGSRLSAIQGTAQILRSYPHPGGLDAAIVQLDRDIVDRPRSRRMTGVPPKGRLLLVGYGANHAVKLTGFGIKRRVDVAAQDWGCDQRRASRMRCDFANEMVLPRYLGRDTCSGDSGGPVFELTATGWRVLAITSRSLSGGRRRCGQGGIYVRVDVLRAWIESTIN